MSEQTTAVATREAAPIAKRPVPVGDRGIVIADLDGMWRWANYVAVSGLAPKGMEKPESIVVATQMGLEVGLTPMAAVQSIAVINGRPAIWGDAQLGIVRATGELEEFSEWYEVKGQRTNRNPATFEDDVTAVCKVKRRGYETQESAFSVADAKKAGLWGKTGPWSQYPARMLKFRARGFALRDNFGDALRGLLSTEEAQDVPPVVVDIAPAQPEPPKFKPRQKAIAEAPPAPATDFPAADTKPQPVVEVTTATVDGGGSLTASQAKLMSIIESEGGTFQTLLYICGDPNNGLSAWKHIVEGVKSPDQLKEHDVQQLLGKEKPFRGFIQTAVAAGIK